MTEQRLTDTQLLDALAHAATLYASYLAHLTLTIDTTNPPPTDYTLTLTYPAQPPPSAPIEHPLTLTIDTTNPPPTDYTLTLTYPAQPPPPGASPGAPTRPPHHT